MVTDNNFPRYYILAGRQPFAVDMTTWARWFENMDNRRVALTMIDEGLNVYVSTVFLGLDHNWSCVGDPILFETMSFGPSAQTLPTLEREIEHDEMTSRRYCTWAQAEAGHAEIVAELTALVERIKADSAGVLNPAAPLTRR